MTRRLSRPRSPRSRRSARRPLLCCPLPSLLEPDAKTTAMTTCNARTRIRGEASSNAWRKADGSRGVLGACMLSSQGLKDVLLGRRHNAMGKQAWNWRSRTRDRLEDINTHCLEQFRTHWKCLDNNNHQLWQCRPEEWKLSKCVYDNMVRLAPSICKSFTAVWHRWCWPCHQ